MELCHLLGTNVKFVKKLCLGSNGITSLWKNTLSRCPPNRGLLDIFFNQLRKVSCLHFLKVQDQIKNFTAEKSHLTSLMSPNLTDLSYRYNRILNVNSFAFHHTPNVNILHLNINIITYLDHKADESCHTASGH